MVGRQVANVEVGAVVVGRNLSVAAEENILVAREATATVVHQHGVLPIADHTDFRHIGDGVEVARVALGLHLAVLVALVLRHLEVYIGLHLRLLLEKGLHAAHGGVVHEIALQAACGEVVSQRGENHTLVVGIVGLDGHMVLVVVAFVEAELVVHVEGLEALDVVVDGAVVHTDGHQRAVGRHHDAVRRGVLELEVGNTERMVLVIAGVVELIISCLGNTPRKPFALNEGALRADGEAVGLVHQGVLVGGQEDERHEVLEHRAVPRGHPLVALILHERLVETEPMLVGRVALGDGEERGEARLGGEVVVVVGQQGVGTGVVADAEDIKLGVIELGEVGLRDETLHSLEQPFSFL